MTAGELRVTVRHRGGTTVIDLAGDVDRAAEVPLRRATDQAAAEGGPRVLLNFEQVGFINSSGIAVLVGLLARARAEHRPIAACGLSEHYQKIFDVTRLSDFIDIYPDEDSAIDGAATGTDVRAAREGGGT